MTIGVFGSTRYTVAISQQPDGPEFGGRQDRNSHRTVCRFDDGKAQRSKAQIERRGDARPVEFFHSRRLAVMTSPALFVRNQGAASRVRVFALLTPVSRPPSHSLPLLSSNHFSRSGTGGDNSSNSAA